MQGAGRLLIIVGLVCVAMGLVMVLRPKMPWLGRLPGDLLIERDRFTLSIPLASCVMVSLVVSLVLWLIGRFR